MVRGGECEIQSNIKNLNIYPELPQFSGLAKSFTTEQNAKFDLGEGLNSSTPMGSSSDACARQTPVVLKGFAGSTSGAGFTAHNITLHENNEVYNVTSVDEGEMHSFNYVDRIGSEHLSWGGESGEYPFSKQPSKGWAKSCNNLLSIEGSWKIRTLHNHAGHIVLGRCPIQTFLVGRNGLWAGHPDVSKLSQFEQPQAPEDQGGILIEDGTMSAKAFLDTTHPSDSTYKEFKIGAGTIHPSAKEGLQMNSTEAIVKLQVNQLMVADFVGTGVTSGNTGPQSGSQMSSTYTGK